MPSGNLICRQPAKVLTPINNDFYVGSDPIHS